MKLIILCLIIALSKCAQFEIGSIDTGNIKGHKIYKQDVRFREQFQNIPKIALSMTGFQSKLNSLDFFSRTTEVTNQGFLLQVISDVEIDKISFNYLATENDKVQIICNNIEVKKDQIDIKFNSAFDEVPQVATFLTGVHKITQDDLILKIDYIEKDQVHLLTQSKAESSLGICLLVGPHDIFLNKDMSMQQITQSIPHSIFYGISSLVGQTQNGIAIYLNNKNQNINSYDIGLSVAEMILDEKTKQELEQHEVSKIVQFDDLVGQLTPEEPKQQETGNNQEPKEQESANDQEPKQQVTVNDQEQKQQEKLNNQPEEQKQQESLNDQSESIQSMQFIYSENEETESNIQSLTFVSPTQQFTQYFEDEDQSLQSADLQNQEVMTINETWLQNDIVVIESQDASLDSNDNQQSQQLLTNLIKPEDFNSNQIDDLQNDSFVRQPENVVIVDSTDLIVSEYEQAEVKENNIDQTSYQQENYVDEENNIESNEKVEQLENIVQNLQEEVMNLSKTNNAPQTLNEQEQIDIIQQQKFIVEQQKQLVEQQQQIIQQYQHMIEEQKKIIEDQLQAKQSNEVEDQENSSQTKQIENSIEPEQSNTENQEQEQEQKKESQLMSEYQQQPQQLQQQEKFQQQTKQQQQQPENDAAQNLNSKNDDQDQSNFVASFDNDKQLKEDLASFDHLKVKKMEEGTEKQITQILNDLSEDQAPHLNESEKLNNLQQQLENVVDLLGTNHDDSSNKYVNQHIEYSKSNNYAQNQNELDQLDLRKISLSDQLSLEPENITLEELSETIFPKEYEVEQAYFDWTLKQNYSNQKQQNQQNQELLQKQNEQQEESQRLQKQIQEFLELDSNDQSFSDPLIDEFHSFFSVNQKIKNNLRKRRVLNV